MPSYCGCATHPIKVTVAVAETTCPDHDSPARNMVNLRPVRLAAVREQPFVYCPIFPRLTLSQEGPALHQQPLCFTEYDSESLGTGEHDQYEVRRTGCEYHHQAAEPPLVLYLSKPISHHGGDRIMAGISSPHVNAAASLCNAACLATRRGPTPSRTSSKGRAVQATPAWWNSH